MGRVSTRGLVVVGLLVALLLAGVASSLASTSPDGLSQTAQKYGFAEERSPAAGQPLAGYQARGVANSDASVGVAGVAGCALVLLLMSGLGVAVGLRRRGIGGA